MNDEAFGAGFFFGLLFVGLFMGGIIYLNEGRWESAAIERGYATYCPMDGEWAWKGECK